MSLFSFSSSVDFEIEYWYSNNKRFVSDIEYIIQKYCNKEDIKESILSIIKREYFPIIKLKVPVSSTQIDLDNQSVYDCLFEIREYCENKLGTNMLSSMSYFDLYPLLVHQ